jgi:penicillin-binding protein 1A
MNPPENSRKISADTRSKRKPDADWSGPVEPRSWKQKATLYGLVGIGALGAAGLLAGIILVWVLMRDLPSVETLNNYKPAITTRVYAGNGQVLGEYARQRRIFVPIAFIPKLVAEAFTSAEDRNFYNHPGIDPGGIARAAIKDVYNVMVGRRLEGASTITQQVAKNFLLNSDVKFSRKIREAVLAIRIDATYSKDHILELYLNEIYLGGSAYGVGAAALSYFGKSLDELTIPEVAFLAALPKAPSAYDPRRNKQAALERRNWVIGQMADNGYISDDEAKAAIATPLETGMRPLGSQAVDVDYFVEEVRRLLYARYGEKGLYDDGMQVRSSLDTSLQNFAVSALRNGLVRYDRRHGWRGATSSIAVNGALPADWKAKLAAVPNISGIEAWRLAAVQSFGTDRSIAIGFADGSTGKIPFSEYSWARKDLRNGYTGAYPTKPQDIAKIGDVLYVEAVEKRGEFGLRQIPEVNGGFVAMDPHTGRVLALSGGFSYASSQFDRAMQALRQPGSAFKPFVYAAALDNGYTPVSKELDAPIAIEQGPGLPLWTPGNFEKGEFLGLATLRRGLELSHNLMTIRLAQNVGMDKVVQYPIRMGVYDKLQPMLANSIGSAETTLLRVVTGYSEFVNGGKKVEPSLIDRIQDRDGKTIWVHDKRKCEGCNVAWNTNAQEPLLEDVRPQVLDPRTAYQIVSMLEGVIQRGTGVSIKVIGKPLAGKTGTSNDIKDTWFVGFSPDLAAGVYVGFDNPRTLGNEQGATVAAPIFRDFMKEALADKPPTPFRVPPGIELRAVDRFSGALSSPGAPGAIMEAFKEGTAPGEYDAPTPNYGGSGENSSSTPGNASAPAKSVGEGTGGLY